MVLEGKRTKPIKMGSANLSLVWVPQELKGRSRKLNQSVVKAGAHSFRHANLNCALSSENIDHLFTLHISVIWN
ncbi:hypothetical protein C5167_048331 [Papaver somniferum]|uniref:Uncharacterized protein n=1 Tax=Papaver somniferum TaxID=3469 RepID=A0A4Y7KKK4_PAPSO|nr:hypothetical protein C5167_048331 [Papaver somniferum]